MGPAGTSVKSMWHYSQLIQNGRFQMYDYGWNGNIQRYHQPTPPSCHVSDMKVPVAMFSGADDWLSTPQDVHDKLIHGVPNLLTYQQDNNWNHMDYLWAENAKELIYDKIFQLLEGNIPQ